MKGSMWYFDNKRDLRDRFVLIAIDKDLNKNMCLKLLSNCLVVN